MKTFRIELRAEGVHVTMPYEAETMADAVHRSVGVAKAHESVHPGVEWTYIGVTVDKPNAAKSGRVPLSKHHMSPRN